jgi:hypothetical protein
MYYSFSFDWDEGTEEYTSNSMPQLMQIKNKTVKTQPHKLVLDAISIHLAGHLKQHAEANSWDQSETIFIPVTMYGCIILDLYKNRKPLKTIRHQRFDALKENGVMFRAVADEIGAETGWYDWGLWSNNRDDDCTPNRDDPIFPKNTWLPAKIISTIGYSLGEGGREHVRMVAHCAWSHYSEEDSIITKRFLMHNEQGTNNPVLTVMHPKVIKDRIYVMQHHNPGKQWVDYGIPDRDPNNVDAPKEYAERCTLLLDMDTYWAYQFVDYQEQEEGQGDQNSRFNAKRRKEDSMQKRGADVWDRT